MEISFEFFQNFQRCKFKAWNFKNEKEPFEFSVEGSCLHIYLPDKKITKDDSFAILAWFYDHELLGQNIIDRIKTHYGDPENWETISMRLTKPNSKAQRLLAEAKTILQRSEPPSFYRNPHCSECPLQHDCIKKLKEKDCISLLGGITEKSLLKYHKKGVFTILQLSHLFRPRRRGRELYRAGHYLWELKALAIREQKTFVLQKPEINNSPVSIFMDFEGLPDENFIYLIGIIIQQENQQKHFSFWANIKDDEEKIFFQLVEILDQYPDIPIYHYGSYENAELKKLFRLYSEDWKEKFETIQKRMINLLGFLRAHVYPPIYTNGLKDLGNFLQYQWADLAATGLKSITWRKEWELTVMNSLKEKLINYNFDDCRALIKVHQWLFRLSEGNEIDVQQVSEMKRQSPYNFKKNVAFAEDFQVINNAAYFDYQRSKIYFRNNRNRIKPAKSEKHLGRGIATWQPKKVNEIIDIPPLLKCPHCGCKKLYHGKAKRTFRQTDLKFTAKAIRQWVIEYRSGKGKCARCAMQYYDSTLRMLHYGQNLFAWAMNLYVNYHISNAKISQLLKEQFGIYTNKLYFTDRRRKWIPQFQEEVEYLWKIVRNSPVVHIDETTVRLSKGSGYIWAFATTHTVFYHLTLKRESEFLTEWLKDYDGIIVTDFFSGYDSLPFKRQKCLIHLIRDLNDDLFKNPFDEQYKIMVTAFGVLLKSIIATIDKHGLKKRNLKKHITQTEKFFEQYIEIKTNSELYAKYSKRLKKHWSELWTFLYHDDLPWNNNNAEAAIKAFALYRRGVNGQVSAKGLNDYLSMLSLSQSCKFRNISFLDYLRRKAGIWQNVPAHTLPGYLPFEQTKLYAQKMNFINKEEWYAWKASGNCPAFISPEYFFINTKPKQKTTKKKSYDLKQDRQEETKSK